MLKQLRDAHLDDKLILHAPRRLLESGDPDGPLSRHRHGLALRSVSNLAVCGTGPVHGAIEKAALAGFILPAVGLFFGGLAFAYYVIMPYLMRFLVSFQGQGPFTPLISIEEYFDLVLIVLVGVGAVFELPMLIFVLSIFGLVTPSFLWKNFRYALLIIAVVAAIITPTPDATTMLIFMAPMIALYIVGIGVSWMVVRKKRRRQELTGGGAA